MMQVIVKIIALMKTNKLQRYVGVALLLLMLSLVYLLIDYQRFLNAPLIDELMVDKSMVDKPEVQLIESGSSLKRFANSLYKQGLLAHPRYFVLHARLSGNANRIQAGEYLLDQGLTPRQLLVNITEGKVVQYPVTLIEGHSFKQLLQALEGLEWLEHSLSGLSPADVSKAFKWPEANPEGLLLADTYYVTRGTSDRDVLLRARQAMRDYLQQQWPDRDADLPYESPYQVLIMASIIEKETAVPSERAEIAGVFVRRLKKRMRLQTDPTVIYGMGDAYDGNIRRRDLRRDTLYNTYTRKGLPPTPIALPGEEAVFAALHPAPGTTLYFVARGDGTHYFSATLDEHLSAVRRYQLGRK